MKTAKKKIDPNFSPKKFSKNEKNSLSKKNFNFSYFVSFSGKSSDSTDLSGKFAKKKNQQMNLKTRQSMTK